MRSTSSSGRHAERHHGAAAGAAPLAPAAVVHLGERRTVEVQHHSARQRHVDVVDTAGRPPDRRLRYLDAGRAIERDARVHVAHHQIELLHYRFHDLLLFAISRTLGRGRARRLGDIFRRRRAAIEPPLRDDEVRHPRNPRDDRIGHFERYARDPCNRQIQPQRHRSRTSARSCAPSSADVSQDRHRESPHTRALRYNSHTTASTPNPSRAGAPPNACVDMIRPGAAADQHADAEIEPAHPTVQLRTPAAQPRRELKRAETERNGRAEDVQVQRRLVRLKRDGQAADRSPIRSAAVRTRATA